MQVYNDPRISDITLKTSSQVGKTEILNNITGYIVDRDPAPMLVVLPTLDMARTWSKDRLEPMIRDTPALTGKIGDEGKTRRSDETILRKRFEGGQITIAGANSASSLSSRPVRVVLADEVSRFPPSAGKEGDPLKLAHKRTSNFHNRKHIDTSTPTIRGACRITARYEASDMRRFFVPCPDCGEEQYLKWKNVHFLPEGTTSERAESARYVCECCGSAWTELEKRRAVKRGRWIATNPDANGRHAGFHLWEIYSPWSSMREIVEAFLEAKDDPETLQVFINTVLGEVWEERGENTDQDALSARREMYPADVPREVLAIVAGVDIQDDRIECEAVGYSETEECYGIEYRVIYGDTEGDQVWQDLDDWLKTKWQHEAGGVMGIAAAAVDSGYRTETVYDFCRARSKRRVFAVKGEAGAGKPITRPPTRKKTGKRRAVDLFPVGVDEAKTSVHRRLNVTQPGPKYCHFPLSYPDSFFDGLAAEQRMKRIVKGFPVYYWQKLAGRKNEPLDLRVYGLAALMLLRPVWPELKKRIHSEPIEAPAGDDGDGVDPPPPKRKKRTRRRSKPGFVGGFKR